MKDSKPQNPAGKSTPIDVEGKVNNSQVSEDFHKKKKHKCIKGKLPILLSVIFVLGVAVGTYFVVVSTGDNEDDMNSFSTKSQRNKTSSAVQSNKVSDVSSVITAGLDESSDKEINGTGFKTDPICRDFLKSSVFVFDCYHQRAFNALPINSTVKCSYLNRVGLCIQDLLENEYGVDCDRLDQLYLLNLNAEVLKERSNFDAKTECGEWYTFYTKATNRTLV
ncbi:uncharacterized protein LOC110448657 isoform X1 [Mizuhopecten yessoensis]|uniref:uncharacterized protein LOC110448657 isoform X1 n=1 Tax=Mizuhopecten yessoensis TaxID=6573 RepID=UPI000B458DD1|nr:uncharacterized protein LOC110448657 isoform X1 [Mizuhopecten yessoensis]